MTKHVETQTQINGPYEPTNLTLEECWDIDLGNMVDYNLLRDNATETEDYLILTMMRQSGLLPETVLDYVGEQIEARVLAAGQYVRDSKWTREEA
jgi:hypothetical protein